jgi:hypothetical protein
MFKYQSGFFVNINNKKVLDVSGGRDEEGRNVQVWGRNGSAAQRWRVVYHDNMGKDAIQKKGVDRDFGFRVNRQFYFRSRLPMQRVVEAIGASNLVIK